MFRALIGAATLGVALLAVPATAGEDQGNSMQVTYGDLDLSTDSGKKELEARLTRAARQVCEVDRKQTGTRMVTSEQRRCLARAKKDSKELAARIISENQLGG